MEISSVNTGNTSTVRTQPKEQEAQKMLSTPEATSQPQQEHIEKAVKEAAREAASRDQLIALAAEMNEMARPLHTRISFGFSENASAMFLNVIDNDSGQVIRQFPSEEALDFAAKMREWVGMLLDQRI